MSKPPPLILLVADDPDVREVLADMVNAAGFRIETASTYGDGVVLLNASLPALLISDAPLPGAADGHTLAERARRHGFC